MTLQGIEAILRDLQEMEVILLFVLACLIVHIVTCLKHYYCFRHKREETTLNTFQTTRILQIGMNSNMILICYVWI